MFIMRFAMRSKTSDPAERADAYKTSLEMCAWSETRGCAAAVVSQHHGVDDGYLPSPVPLASAIAARTNTLPISVAALLLALYEPVKLAEDLAVVDLISRGRVSYVIGIGYRAEEFAMFGVDRRHRAQTIEQRIGILRELWTAARWWTWTVARPASLRCRSPPVGRFWPTGAARRRPPGALARLGMYFVAETHDSRSRGCIP